MLALLPILAAEVTPDTLISGNWLIAISGVFAGALVGLVQEMRKRSAVEAVRSKNSTTIEGQPISVDVVHHLATKGELNELEARIVAELKKFENALATERSIARTANGNLHARMDKTGDAVMEMRGELHQINANLNRLVDLAMKPANPRKLS
ncbi:MAG: hypothetical protein WCK77_23180 [Verrucomicrobiota bacterium]